MRTPLTFNELMDRYKPDMGWLDRDEIGFPPNMDPVCDFVMWLLEHTVVLEREDGTPPPADPDLSQLGNRDLIYGTPPEPPPPSAYVVPPVWRFLYSQRDRMKEGFVLAHDEHSARQQAMDLLADDQTLEQVWLESEPLGLRAEPCYSCGSTEGVSYGPCPYQSEINGDETPLWICDGCRTEATREI